MTARLDEEVATVALLVRRVGMSVDLFSRYWRDVHGVLAVRIPGFWSYTQYHLEPASQAATGGDAFRIDGLAEVTFRNAADRAALSVSAVTPLILRDETNVFSRTLLYSLDVGASVTQRAPADEADAQDYTTPAASYVLIAQSPAAASARDGAAALESALIPQLKRSEGLMGLRTHLLASGDPSLWNTMPGVDNTETGSRNSVVLLAQWQNPAAAEAALAGIAVPGLVAFTDIQPYRVRTRCAMVVRGRPTHLGLRGFDVLQTIKEAGADNQKESEVLRCVYGVSVDP